MFYNEGIEKYNNTQYKIVAVRDYYIDISRL